MSAGGPTHEANQKYDTPRENEQPTMTYPASELDRVLEPEIMDTDEEANGYAAMDHSATGAAFVQRLIELGATGHALDIGTGPGTISILAAESIPTLHITAVDLSPKMLAHANALREKSHAKDRVSFEIADAKFLPYESESFDVVFSNTILHHIPDPTHMLIEACRLLRPGGTLLIRDLYRPNTQADLDALVAKHGAEDTEYNRELFRASLHAALSVEELAMVAESAFLEEAEIVIDTDRHVSLQMQAE
ncbi:MAG: ubiquinone/menaquinone biosynthesis C-methylase UbiE [Bacteroidia bacterium]